MDKNTYISNKIKKLMNEGKSQEQSIAIAFSMFEREKDKMQDGGTFAPIDFNSLLKQQTVSPQQDFSVQNQDYLRMAFTPAQPNPISMSPGNYNSWDLDNNGVPDTIQKAEGNPLLPQQEENKTEDNRKYNDFVKYNTLNPYGGIDVMSRLNYGLYNIGKGNSAKGIAGLAGFGLGALREGLSAYGAGKNERQIWESYIDNQYNQPPKYEYAQGGVIDFMQKGGKTIADMMTGNYITEDPNPNAPKNVEVEDGEYVKNSQTGQIVEAVGAKHTEGGVKVNLPNESKVLSDFTKIGVTNAKELKEKFDFSIKAKDTFSDVMDKYKKKVGAEKLEKEEVEVMNMLEKQIKSNISEKTKQINLDFLGKELEEIQSKKTEMQKKIDDAFELLFNKQEKLPKNSTLGMQEGGEVSPEIMQLSEKYGIPPEKVAELLAQQQAPQGTDILQQVITMLQQGVQPEQIVQELVGAGYPQEEAMAIVQQATSKPQEVPTNAEGMPMAQQGWRVNLNQNTQYGKQREQQFVKGAFEEPNYSYESIKDIANRFKYLAEQRGIDYKDLDLTTREGVDKLASKTQAWDKQNLPNLTQDYGMNIGLTKQGIDYFLQNKDLTNKLSKENPQLLKKLQEAKRGVYDSENFTKEDRDAVMGVVSSSGDKTFAEKNYIDNKAYFRGIDKGLIYYDNPDEFNQMEKDSQKIDGYSKTPKKGVYAQRILLQPKYFDTVEERDAWLKANETNAEKQHKNFYSEDPKSNIFYTPIVKGQEPTEQVKQDLNLQNNQIVNRQVTKNIVPLLPYFPQMPPDTMLIPKRQQVDLSRIEPVKIGVEPNLVEAERARLARTESYANLSPEVAAAMQSSDLSSTQQANNQAISSAEVANAQAQFQADQYNNSQRDREQITNLGLDKRYEQEMFATIANQDADWRRYYNAEERQQRANYNTISETNLFNAMNPNYNMNLGTGQVDFINPYMFSNNQNQENKQLEIMMNNTKTPEERIQLIKQLTEYNKTKNTQQ